MSRICIGESTAKMMLGWMLCCTCQDWVNVRYVSFLSSIGYVLIETFEIVQTTLEPEIAWGVDSD